MKRLPLAAALALTLLATACKSPTCPIPCTEIKINEYHSFCAEDTWTPK